MLLGLVALYTNWPNIDLERWKGIKPWSNYLYRQLAYDFSKVLAISDSWSQ